MAEKWKRRNLFIKPDVQGVFILKCFVLVFFCCVLYAVILATFSTDSMTITYQDNNLQLGKTPIILFKEMLKAQGLFIATGGVGVVIFALVSSHRFAGPIYRFENTIRKMTKGDYSARIHLRPKDESHDLAELINDYNVALTSDIRALKESTSQLREQLNRISEHPEEENVFEAFSILHDIENKLRRYKVNY
jgi:methyl-accepting chemotaxis protein